MLKLCAVPSIDQYEAVIEALEEMTVGNSNVATRAGGLLVRFQKGVTLLTLFIALTVIEPLEILNAGLQARERKHCRRNDEGCCRSEDIVGEIVYRRFCNSFLGREK